MHGLSNARFRDEDQAPRGLVVVRSPHHLELGHQAVVLVVEHVAVDDELAGVVDEVAGDEDAFAGVEEEGLLEAVFPGRRRLAVAGEQAPIGQVHVHHVGDVGVVDDLPGLDRAELRLGVGAGRVEGAAVDQPGGLEETADGDLQAAVGPVRDVAGPPRQRPQLARHAGAVGHSPRVDAELHQRPDVSVGAEWVAGAVARAAAQLDALAADGGEVGDQLDPLGRPDSHLAAPHRARHQPAVAADLDQRRAV